MAPTRWEGMLRNFMKSLIASGMCLVVIGVLGLALGFFGVIDFGDYSVGLSSGVRVIGSVGISGCLLCAIGFGWSEYQDYLKKGEENV